MQRAPRITRAHAIALPRAALTGGAQDWVAAGFVLALLLLGLLAP